MPTIKDFHRWQTEHRLVLPNQLESASSPGDWVEVLLLLPLATFIVVEALVRLIGSSAFGVCNRRGRRPYSVSQRRPTQ